jgi:hypothetical protein
MLIPPPPEDFPLAPDFALDAIFESPKDAMHHVERCSCVFAHGFGCVASFPTDQSPASSPAPPNKKAAVTIAEPGIRADAAESSGAAFNAEGDAQNAGQTTSPALALPAVSAMVVPVPNFLPEGIEGGEPNTGLIKVKRAIS